MTMWICPICKTTNETNICRSCGFDHEQRLCNAPFPLPALRSPAEKSSKPVQPGDNILMASSDTDYVFGRKMDRTKDHDHLFPEQERKHRRRCLGRIGKTERQHYGLDRGKTRMACMDLYTCGEWQYYLRIETAASCFMQYEKSRNILWG